MTAGMTDVNYAYHKPKHKFCARRYCLLTLRKELRCEALRMHVFPMLNRARSANVLIFGTWRVSEKPQGTNFSPRKKTTVCEECRDSPACPLLSAYKRYFRLQYLLPTQVYYLTSHSANLCTPSRTDATIHHPPHHPTNASTQPVHPSKNQADKFVYKCGSSFCLEPKGRADATKLVRKRPTQETEDVVTFIKGCAGTEA